jgi:hypothetical protein
MMRERRGSRNAIVQSPGLPLNSMGTQARRRRLALGQVEEFWEHPEEAMMKGVQLLATIAASLLAASSATVSASF